MRTTVQAGLGQWHLAQQFGDTPATAPKLNDAFIQENPPVSRVMAVPSEPHFLCDMVFNYVMTRVMYPRSTPAYLGRPF